MIIAIISDIHDNFANLDIFLNWVAKNKISNLICCGDVTTADTLNILSTKFKGEINLVKGNAEIYTENDIKKYKNIHYFGRIANIKLGKVKIGICHEQFLIKKIIDLGDVDIIFYGHTHKPWQEEEKGVQIVNPGTLGGVFQKATFATYDDEKSKLKLHILDFLE